MEPGDFSLTELAESAEEVIQQGGVVYFKWTCRGCGERVMSSTPNTFHTSMLHEDCGYTTNTEETGGNYLVMLVNPRSVE